MNTDEKIAKMRTRMESVMHEMLRKLPGRAPIAAHNAIMAMCDIRIAAETRKILEEAP